MLMVLQQCCSALLFLLAVLLAYRTNVLKGYIVQLNSVSDVADEASEVV